MTLTHTEFYNFLRFEVVSGRLQLQVIFLSFVTKNTNNQLISEFRYSSDPTAEPPKLEDLNKT